MFKMFFGELHKMILPEGGKSIHRDRNLVFTGIFAVMAISESLSNSDFPLLHCC